MAKIYSQEEIDNEEMLDSMYPAMVGTPHRKSLGGDHEYIDTSASLAKKRLDEKLASEDLRLVELSEEKILELRLNNFVEAAGAAGRGAEDIESMTKYLTAGIKNGSVESLRTGLAKSFAKDYEQQSADLKQRQDERAESRKMDHGVYSNSDFSKIEKTIEEAGLSSTVAYQ